MKKINEMRHAHEDRRRERVCVCWVEGMVGRRTVVFDQRRVPGQGCGEGVLAGGSRWMGEWCRVVTLMLVAGHCGDCAGWDCIDWE